MITVITFAFSEYDFPKKPYFIDNNIKYICVTDCPDNCIGWTPVVDPRLSGKDPIYASYYVRYHAHEYTDSDVIIIMDASVRIESSIMPIVDIFRASGHDIGLTVGGFHNNWKKLKYWYMTRPYENHENYRLAEAAIRDNSITDIEGTTVSTVKLQLNTKKAVQFNEYVWALCLKYGINGNPNRLDEIFVDIALNGIYYDFPVFTMCSQILHSNLFSLHAHGALMPRGSGPNFAEYMFRNKPVHPVCIGSEYPMSYKYKTEAMLLTKYMSSDDLEYWLDWHLNKIGFEHIHVFSNDLPYNAKIICDKFNDRVDFENVTGVPRQYKLYDRYLAIQSKAEWVMPIDDDEFLVFDETMFNSIAEVINYYDQKLPNMEMLAIRWLHLFPEKFHTERNGIPLMEYNCCRSPELASAFERAGDNGVKCIVHRYGWIHYEETVENPGGGHVPKHSNAKSAVGFDGTRITGYCYREDPADTADEKIRLVHCRYWGYSEYCMKFRENKPLRVSDVSHKEKHWRFDSILEQLP